MSPARTRAVTLFSGSSGNALLVESRKTSLLVDAGVCGRSIEEAMARLEADPKKLGGILVTHEHSDHIAGVGVLIRRFKIPLYVNQATWLSMQSTVGKVHPDLVRLIEPGEWTDIGDLSFSSFRTPHDATDPVGYRIVSDHGTISIMTDIGNMNRQLSDAVAKSDVLFIEANYDDLMLEHGPYPRVLKNRIAGDHGHLSNDDCGMAIGTLLQRGTNRFVLAHLSKENNFPELAYDTVVRRLADMGIDARRDLQLQVARRMMPGDPVTL